MPGSTPRLALPFPLGTDPLSGGDDAIGALAAKLEALNLAWQMAAGTITLSTTSLASAGSVFTPITFPVGRFTLPPLVLVTMGSASSGSAFATCRAHVITKDGFSIVITNVGTAAMSMGAAPFSWLAVQFSASAAPG